MVRFAITLNPLCLVKVTSIDQIDLIKNDSFTIEPGEKKNKETITQYKRKMNAISLA